MTAIALETARPEISRLGMGGRITKNLAQPVYTYNNQLVAHMAGKLRKVVPTGPDTATVDLLAKPVYEFPERPARKELGAALQALGAVKFTPASKPAPAAKAKPKASRKAKAAPQPKAGGHSLEAIITAIMSSPASMDEKVGAIAALR